MFDDSTPQGRRAAERLTKEAIGWLTTVSPGGTPHTSPVWFLWQDDAALIYSLDDTARIRNLREHARVSLHLDGDGTGGDIVVIEGDASIDRDTPPADRNAEYVSKYGWHMESHGWTPEWFASKYPVPIRIRATRARVW